MSEQFGTPALYIDATGGGGAPGPGTGIELVGTPPLILAAVNQNTMIPDGINGQDTPHVGPVKLLLPQQMSPDSCEVREQFGYPSLSTPSEQLEDPAEVKIQPEFWLLPRGGQPVVLATWRTFPSPVSPGRAVR